MRPAASSLLALSLCGASLNSWAQDVATERQRADRSLNDPSVGSPVTSSGTRVSLESSTVDSVAKALIGVNLGNKLLSLAVETPVRKGSKETAFADLSGLRGGAVATLSLTRFYIKANPDPEKLFAVCRDFNAERAATFERDYGRKLIPSDPSSCTVAALSARGEPWTTRAQAAERDGLRDTCTAINKAGSGDRIINELGECTLDRLDARDPEYSSDAKQKVAEELKKVCEAFNSASVSGQITGVCGYTELLDKGKEWESKALDAAGVGTHAIVNAFVSGRSDQFEFIELPSLEKQKKTSNGVAVGASVGFVTRGDVYLGVGFRIERSYRAGDAAQYCIPIPDTGAERCQELVSGAPAAENARVIQAEARYYPAKWLGLIPRVSYETKTNVAGFQLLTFFLKDKEKGLNGGIDFGYRSDTGTLTARLFIGAAFELLR